MLNNTNEIKGLAERFSKLKTASGEQKISDEKAWALAHALSEFEEIYTNFLQSKLPKLADENTTDDELKDLLQEIDLDVKHLKMLFDNFE